MLREKISVVIPVYNVAEYVEECLKSILNQTYSHLDIIIIDDGSTDDSYNVVKKVIEKDERVTLLQQENKGLSEARNVGIKYAKGEYITFIDSDDYILPIYIEVLYKNLIKYQADISIVNSRRLENSKIKRYLDNNQKDVMKMSNLEVLEKMYSSENDFFGILVVGQNKLYKKFLFDDIKYPVGKKYEDEFTTYKLYLKTNKIVYIHQDLYVYRLRQGSILRSGYSLKNLDKLDMFEERINIFKENNIDIFLTNQSYFKTLIKEYLYLLKFDKYNNNLEKINQKQKKIYVELFKTLKIGNKIKFQIASKIVNLVEITRRFYVRAR